MIEDAYYKDLILECFQFSVVLQKDIDFTLNRLKASSARVETRLILYRKPYS
jgi:hypothetical protein